MATIKTNGKALMSLVAAIMLLTTTASCGDFLEEYSQDLARVKTTADLEELVTGDCLLPLGFVSGATFMPTMTNHNFDIVHFMSDELDENLQTYYAPYYSQYTTTVYYPYFTWQRDCFLDEEGNNTLKANEEQYWKLGYEKIANCNMVIDAAQNHRAAKNDDQAVINRVMGECHFLRANYYFMLVNLYAKPYSPDEAATTDGIPIKTSAQISDQEYQRNSVEEVYQLILSDLGEAEKLLSGVSPKSKYHAGPAAVYIFRSRVAAFMQNWTEAEHYAELALQQNNSLIDLRNWPGGYPVSSESEEVIFSNGSTCFGNTIFQEPGKDNYYEDTYAPYYVISTHLLSLFSENDGRRQAYITNTDDVNGCWSYHKIDNSTASFNTYKTASDVFCLRSAEAYLLLAEAQAHLGKNTEACRQLNTLRAKRIDGAENITLSGSDLMTFIREERERELCLEGHRWFDLRRYQVDKKYPYSTTIEHTFSYINIDGYLQLRDHINHYRLEPGDDAYTLNIPRTVRDQQPSIGSNPRPDRTPYAVTKN